MGEALHYIGMTELADGETLAQAHARVVAAYQATHLGYTLKAGAVDIIKAADGATEYIYDGSEWGKFGDEGIYETKAEAEAEHSALSGAISAVATDLGQEVDRAKAAENALGAEVAKKTTQEIVGTMVQVMCGMKQAVEARGLLTTTVLNLSLVLTMAQMVL